MIEINNTKESNLNNDEEIQISRGRNYAVWARRSNQKERKTPNQLILLDTISHLYKLDNTEIPEETKQYINSKLEVFNKISISTFNKILRIILIIVYIILLVVYIYTTIIISLITLYNPLIVITLLYSIYHIIKLFIFLDYIYIENKRKKALNTVINKQNMLSQMDGYLWVSGRDGYWLELVKL